MAVLELTKSKIYTGEVRVIDKSSIFCIKKYPCEIYSVSSNLWLKQETPGGAIMQTWIIKGKDRIMAIDSPIPAIEGFHDFLEKNFELPIMMVNSHGHVDHIGCNEQFKGVWLSKEDWSLIAGGGIERTDCSETYKKLGYELYDIHQGHIFELGERDVIAYHIPGHTCGSMVFYDKKSKGLFSGDTVARRVLYGISDWTPLENYLSGLSHLKEITIEGVYSMHDNCILMKDMPERIIYNIRTYLRNTKLDWVSPIDGRLFKRILIGQDEMDEDFFDFVIPKDKMMEEQKSV